MDGPVHIANYIEAQNFFDIRDQATKGGQRCRAAAIRAKQQPAPYTHFSEQLKRLAAEHRVRIENSRSAVGATSL
jgi:hypothetical protein